MPPWLPVLLPFLPGVVLYALMVAAVTTTAIINCALAPSEAGRTKFKKVAEASTQGSSSVKATSEAGRTKFKKAAGASTHDSSSVKVSSEMLGDDESRTGRAQAGPQAGSRYGNEGLAQSRVKKQTDSASPTSTPLLTMHHLNSQPYFTSLYADKFLLALDGARASLAPLFASVIKERALYGEGMDLREVDDFFIISGVSSTAVRTLIRKAADLTTLDDSVSLPFIKELFRSTSVASTPQFTNVLSSTDKAAITEASRWSTDEWGKHLHQAALATEGSVNDIATAARAMMAAACCASSARLAACALWMLRLPVESVLICLLHGIVVPKERLAVVDALLLEKESERAGLARQLRQAVVAQQDEFYADCVDAAVATSDDPRFLFNLCAACAILASLPHLKAPLINKATTLAIENANLESATLTKLGDHALKHAASLPINPLVAFVAADTTQLLEAAHSCHFTESLHSLLMRWSRFHSGFVTCASRKDAIAPVKHYFTDFKKTLTAEAGRHSVEFILGCLSALEGDMDLQSVLLGMQYRKTKIVQIFMALAGKVDFESGTPIATARQVLMKAAKNIDPAEYHRLIANADRFDAGRDMQDVTESDRLDSTPPSSANDNAVFAFANPELPSLVAYGSSGSTPSSDAEVLSLTGDLDSLTAPFPAGELNSPIRTTGHVFSICQMFGGCTPRLGASPTMSPTLPAMDLTNNDTHPPTASPSYPPSNAVIRGSLPEDDPLYSHILYTFIMDPSAAVSVPHLLAQVPEKFFYKGEKRMKEETVSRNLKEILGRLTDTRFLNKTGVTYTWGGRCGVVTHAQTRTRHGEKFAWTVLVPDEQEETNHENNQTEQTDGGDLESTQTHTALAASPHLFEGPSSTSSSPAVPPSSNSMANDDLLRYSPDSTTHHAIKKM